MYATTRPAKPTNDYPLYAHATGRWAKKIKGKLYYFGKWDDPAGALTGYLQFCRDQTTLNPTEDPGNTTVEVLCQRWLSLKEMFFTSGELARRTFEGYTEICDLLTLHLGRTKLIGLITPEDFQGLRRVLAEKWGPVRLGNSIQVIRSIFRYAGPDQGKLISHPIHFGPAFRKPSAKALRINRNEAGERLFSPKEIREVLRVASVNLRAMVLLGINGGLGNTDIGELPIRALSLDTGWVHYPRPKTGINRRIPLWKETVSALRLVLDKRPQPLYAQDLSKVFIGKHGKNYADTHRGHRVAGELRRYLDKAEIEGRSFYDLRRTFQTIGEEGGDLVAVSAIMGHAPRVGDMSAVYRQRIKDERLLAVVNYIRDWVGFRD